MIKGKIASIAFGGLAGYLLISRAFSLVENGIKNVCEASKWKNYYKYGGDGNVVAPGYSMHTHKIDDDHEVVVEADNSKTNSPKSNEETIAEAIKKAVDGIFDKDKEENKEKLEEPEEVIKEVESNKSNETEEDTDDYLFEPLQFPDEIEEKDESDESLD